ncbi:hypothetical protein DPMN_085122 [Dreissena polymorpha]|uniref:Uncharacterized protein n=1 Tax=Dreissena polymorpha TaxID=45954 RepID=A0A9D3YD25_DREPO|nr:hypothetical protein DPMN_085122 [Dreissena polymorpha]
MYIDGNDCRPGLWETLYNLNIKSLRVSGNIGSLRANHVSSLSLLSLELLETLTMHLFRYIDLQLPQSLRKLDVFFCKLSSSELRELVSKFSQSTGSVRCRLEFGFYREIVNESDLGEYSNNQFPREEYIRITQTLAAPENVEVERFKISNTRNNAVLAWSVREGIFY